MKQSQSRQSGEQKSSQLSGKQDFIQRSNILRVGDTAPDFTAESTLGEIRFHDYIRGHWTLFFSHPLAFTPVCTTELGQASKLKDEFEKRNVRVLALSVDDVETHKKWMKDINDICRCNIDYPMIGDKDRKVSMLYNMLDPLHSDKDGLPLTGRYMYVIDPNMTIKLIMAYPRTTGRNFDEILRILDSLVVSHDYHVVTPANWKQGDKVIIDPKVSDSEASKSFKDIHKVKDYMRTVEMPSK